MGTTPPPGPRPSWDPRDSPGQAGGGPPPAGRGGERPALGQPLAVRTALALCGLAILGLTGWWVLAATTLADASNDERCDTTLPSGAATDLLTPVHALVAVVLATAVAVLTAAAPPGPPRIARVVALAVVAALSLVMLVPAEPAVFVLLGGAIAAVALLPAGLVTAAGLLLVGRHSTDVPRPRWARRRLAIEALAWPLLVGAPALSALWATLTFADLFCF